MAELGWLHRFHAISAVDKELDSKPEENHKFLAQRQALLEKKRESPRMRVTATMSKNLFETISINEERRTGLKGPKTHWMELTKYEARFGKANPANFRSHMIDGKMVTGVDYVLAEVLGLSTIRSF